LTFVWATITRVRALVALRIGSSIISAAVLIAAALIAVSARAARIASIIWSCAGALWAFSMGSLLARTSVVIGTACRWTRVAIGLPTVRVRVRVRVGVWVRVRAKGAGARVPRAMRIIGSALEAAGIVPVVLLSVVVVAIGSVATMTIL